MDWRSCELRRLRLVRGRSSGPCSTIAIAPELILAFFERFPCRWTLVTVDATFRIRWPGEISAVFRCRFSSMRLIRLSLKSAAGGPAGLHPTSRFSLKSASACVEVRHPSTALRFACAVDGALTLRVFDC